MIKRPDEISKLFTTKRVLIAVVIGLSVSFYLIFKDFRIDDYSNIDWTLKSIYFLFIAFVLMLVRDLAYMYRLRILTDNNITWKHSFQTIMLWEFASALTPSVVGGSAVALFIVNKEISNPGRSTAVVMITAMLDEMFYIVMVPIIFIFAGSGKLFVEGNFSFFNLFELQTKYIFIAGYIFILILTLIISIGIFIRPKSIKRLLFVLFAVMGLKKWLRFAIKTGNEIVISSDEMKGKSFTFWFKAFMATFFSWTARFWVVNFLILTLVAGGDQLLIYARQLVMWVILLISPTPGGSGVAEYMLPRFLGEFMNGYGDEIALAWRLISYYAYLIIGAIVLPVWLRRVYKKKKATSEILLK